MAKLWHLSSAIMVVSLTLASVAGPASAAPPDPSGMASLPPRSTAAQHPLDLSDPVVGGHVADIKARGGEILSGQTVAYELKNEAKGETKDSGGATPMVYPTGCGLSVILYRWGGAIVSSSVTSCPYYFTSGEMDSWIGFWAWLRWYNPVAQNNRYSPSATSFINEYSYTCRNSNNTSYRTETYGDLLVGGKIYRAAAWDEVRDVACGT